MSTKIIGIAAFAAVAVFAAAFFLRTPDTAPATDTVAQVPATTVSEATSTPATTTPTQTSKTPAATKPSSSPAQTPAPTPAPAPVPAKEGYTLAQVAAHNNASSCWTAINGKVYDVTAWINQHPGGRGAILSLCGKDGSAAFNDQHGGERRPESELASFYLAPLI